MNIEHTQAELNTFCRYFSEEGSRLIKFSDFSKAFLPVDKDKCLTILKR